MAWVSNIAIDDDHECHLQGRKYGHLGSRSYGLRALANITHLRGMMGICSQRRTQKKKKKKEKTGKKEKGTKKKRSSLHENYGFIYPGGMIVSRPAWIWVVDGGKVSISSCCFLYHYDFILHLFLFSCSACDLCFVFMGAGDMIQVFHLA